MQKDGLVDDFAGFGLLNVTYFWGPGTSWVLVSLAELKRQGTTIQPESIHVEQRLLSTHACKHHTWAPTVCKRMAQNP